jgi:fatty-acyl-CoA synthase
VVLKPGQAGTVAPEELRRFMAGFAEQGKLPRYAVPERFELVEALPKTSVGKLDKKRLRQQQG